MLRVELYHNHPVLKAFVLILQDEVEHTKHSHCGKPTVSSQINIGFSSGKLIYDVACQAHPVLVFCTSLV